MKKALLMTAGFTSLALGTIGVVMPLLPTTPFVLLAAICFSSVNQKMYERLRKNRIFGQYIENYRTKQGISKRHKYGSIAFMWAGMITSAVLIGKAHVCVVLFLVGTGVTIHLLMIKTKT